MTDAERIQRLEQDNRSLWLLLGTAIQAMPEPREGRQPGELVNPKFWGDRAWDNLTRDLSTIGRFHGVDDDWDAA